MPNNILKEIFLCQKSYGNTTQLKFLNTIKKNSVPYDYLLNTNKSYAYLLKKFIFCIKNHKTLIRTKQIEKKKFELKSLYESPKEVITLQRIGKWGAVQVVKVVLGMPVIPGR